MSILVQHLTKHYEYYEKEVGLRHSLKNLFHRHKLIKEAVKGISFEIAPGEIVGFLGPNGAGKTTALKMLSGILHPTAGDASVLGFRPWERKKAFKRQISIVMGQKNQLWWDLPANESLYLNKCIYELDDRAYADTLDELVTLLDVKEQLKVQLRRLSLGERMKMELVAALIHQPKVILLDEPTIGLDVLSQQSIRHFLKQYNREKQATILLTSHYMQDIQALCDRTLVINHGSLVYDGPLTHIRHADRYIKRITLQLYDTVEPHVLEQFGRLTVHKGLQATLEVPGDELKRVSLLLLEQLPVVDFTVEEPPIEDGIAELFKRVAVVR